MNIFEKLYHDQVFDGVNNITRWNNSRRIKDETVAHHSYLVTLFVNFLVERLCEDLYSVKGREDGYGFLKAEKFKLRVLRSALMHDFDEMISGDVLYTVKSNEFNGKELTRLLDEFVENKVETLLDGVKECEKELFVLSTTYYDDLLIKSIVKVGDWLACLFYIYKERQLGNTCFNNRFDTCKSQTINWLLIAEQNLLSTSNSGMSSVGIKFEEKDLKVLDELRWLIKNI